jgi:hypothetical protein
MRRRGINEKEGNEIVRLARAGKNVVRSVKLLRRSQSQKWR